MEELLAHPVWLFLCACGIPAAGIGLVAWHFKRTVEARDRKREAEQAEKERKAEEREKQQEKLLVSIIETNTAALALGEATALAVQRIPDAHCNGDMHKALDYAKTVKHSQKEYLTSLGIHALYDN